MLIKPGAIVLLKLLSVVLVALYLAASLTPYISPRVCWPTTFLAIAFPLLAVAMVVLAIAWLFFSRRMALLVLLLMAPGFKNLHSVFALRPGGSFNEQKQPGQLRVVSWNVQGFINNARHAEAPDAARRQMINFLKAQQADVLLLQEFVEYHNPLIYSNIQTITDSLGFPYYFFSRDNTLYPSYGQVDFGVAIFSKYPLTDTVKMPYPELGLPENAIAASILFNGSRLRLITTHLASYHLFTKPTTSTDDYFKRSDSNFINTAHRWQKLVYFDRLHARQAAALRAFEQRFKEPVLLAGDFNAVPSSFTYHTIQGAKTDAFIALGSGLGRTFTGLSPTLRIDYILTATPLKPTQYHSPRLYLSDHFPVIADIGWQ